LAGRLLLAYGHASHTAGTVDLLPSGKRGLILGLTLGSRAGEASADEVVQTLPRFLLVPRPLLTSFLSFRSPAGVLAVMGEIAGLPDIDRGRFDDGVLRGPSLGVLREADRRGVCSWELET
jgi:hypothetical protein